jgi:hypothetical protein
LGVVRRECGIGCSFSGGGQKRDCDRALTPNAWGKL